MKIVKLEGVFLNLSLGREKIGTGFSFNDHNLVASQQDSVDSHLFAWNGELEKDSPFVCA